MAKELELDNGSPSQKPDISDPCCDSPDPILESGARLPRRWVKKIPSRLINLPLQDVDPYYATKQQTFVMVTSSHILFRYNRGNALWLLGPTSPIRRICHLLSTHFLFTYLINLAIVVHLLILVSPEGVFETNTEDEIIKIVVLVLYSLEAILRVLSCGFLLGPFSYLRDGWNILDLIVIFATIPGIEFGKCLQGLRAFRLLKMISGFVGFRPWVKSFCKSLKSLGSVLAFALFFVLLYAVLGQQLFMGALRKKCMSDEATNLQNSDNWLVEDGVYVICGNRSGARSCPTGYTCLGDIGDNPDYGYTNYDSYRYSLLSTIRLTTSDYWEGLLHQILSAFGRHPVLIFYFAIPLIGMVFLFGFAISVVGAIYDQAHREEEQWRLEDQEDSSQNDDDIEFIDGVKDKIFVELAPSKVVLEIKDQGGREKFEDPDSGLGHRCKQCCSRCTDLLCVWKCCSCWVFCSEKVHGFVFHPYFELFINVCLVANGVALTLEHAYMTLEMEYTLRILFFLLFLVFFIEMLLKVVALSPKNYFRKGIYIFEFLLVLPYALSFFLLMVGVYLVPLSRPFMTLRLLRIPLSVRICPTFSRIVGIAWKMLRPFWNMVLVHVIVVYALALTGMLAFAQDYKQHRHRFSEEKIPLWSFVDLWRSYLTVFRIACSEWVETMWECMLVSGWACVPFYGVAVILTNLVVLILFIALVLNTFASVTEDEFSPSPGKDSKVEKFCSAVDRAGDRLVSTLCCTQKETSHPSPAPVKDSSPAKDESRPPPADETTPSLEKEDSGTEKKEDGVNSVPQVTVKVSLSDPPNCLHDGCYRRFPGMLDVSDTWKNLRVGCFKLINHWLFDWIVCIVIVISAILLAVESPNSSPKLVMAMRAMDSIFNSLFLVEMVIKWFGLGLHHYFSSPWRRVEFIVVLTSLFNDFSSRLGSGQVPLFRLSRVLRIFYIPAKIERMQVVVRTLIRSTPGLFACLFLCLIAWMPFATWCTGVFSGSFFECVDEEGVRLDPEEVKDIHSCMMKNYTWQSAFINFDNVGHSYIALLEVATFKGWISIFYWAKDSYFSVGQQPVEDANIYCLYIFIFFIWVASFYTLFLFFGVLKESYEKEYKAGFSPCMAKKDFLYHRALRRAVSIKPPKPIPRPQNLCFAKLYDMVTHPTFDLVILIIILVQALLCAIDHYDLDDTTMVILEILSMCILLIYIVEGLLKIMALRTYYFRNPWNILDFCLVVLSILYFIFTGFFYHYAIPFGYGVFLLLRLLKLWQHRIVLRSFPTFKILGDTLAAAMPDVSSVIVLHFLILSAYALVGTAFFGRIAHNSAIDSVFNFENFNRALIILFYMTTGAGWDGILAGTANEEDCAVKIDGEPYEEGFEYEGCGNYAMAVIFCVSNVIISYVILLKLYLVIVVTHHQYCKEDFEEGIIDEDVLNFQAAWKRFNPTGSLYLPLEKLPQLLESLEGPLRIPQPNEAVILAMDIDIYKDNTVHYHDVLLALVTNFFTRRGILPTPLPGDSKVVARVKKSKGDLLPIGSTSQVSNDAFSSSKEV